MKRLSKLLYVSAMGGFIPGFLLTVLGLAESEGGRSDIGKPVAFAGIVLLLSVTVVILALWYKAWESVQDGFARTTPGKAVGFLFIPVYSFYWLFQCIWGFAKDYNQFVVRHSVSAARLPESLFLAFCLLLVVPFSLLVVLSPLVGSDNAWILGGIWMVGELVGFLLGFVVVAKTCDAVNALGQQALSPREAQPALGG